MDTYVFLRAHGTQACDTRLRGAGPDSSSMGGRRAVVPAPATADENDSFSELDIKLIWSRFGWWKFCRDVVKKKGKLGVGVGGYPEN